MVSLDHISFCITKNNIIVPISIYSPELEQVFTDYDFSCMSPNDVVLDVGANIGIFSISASKKCKKVYSVEPLYESELNEVIRLNCSENVTVLPYALSSFENLSLSYGGKSNNVRGLTFSEIKKLCGGKIDFLKCDCEGGEWNISLNELEGINRIEMELHLEKGRNFDYFISGLKDMGYMVRTEPVPISEKLLLLHAYKVHSLEKNENN